MIPFVRSRAAFISILSFMLVVWASASLAQSTQPAPGSNFFVTAITPDGRPAVGAQAVLVPRGLSAAVTDGRAFDDDPAYVRSTADAAGRLTFVDAPATFLLVVIDKTGVAEMDQDALRGRTRVTLQAWGGVKGRRFVGAKPGVGRVVTAWAYTSSDHDEMADPHKPFAVFIGDATVDASGNYQIDRMPPGKAYVAPDDPVKWAKSFVRPMRVVNVTAGSYAMMDIGGRGRAVIGRVDLPAELLNRHDWDYWVCIASPDAETERSAMPKDLAARPINEQIAWWASFNRTAEGKTRKEARPERIWAYTHPFDVQSDGTFRIDDVEPGAYRISLFILTKSAAAARRSELARAQEHFVIEDMPGGRSDSALSLPPIQIELMKDVRVGDLAPDFTATGLDGIPVQLSSYRGKFVLLEFWATTCGPCVEETDQLKAVYDRFRNDGRLVMIGLGVDETPDLPAEYARSHGLAWPQGFLGHPDMEAPAAKLYLVKGIPSLWLIGPDGKVIRKGLRDDNIMPAVSEALAK